MKVLHNNEEIDIKDAISKDIVFFNCKSCGQEIKSQYSNFKNRKHFLCISCIRKKTMSNVHKKRSESEKKEINKKISQETKKAVNSFTQQKRNEITKKMMKSMDWGKRNQHWKETMSSKTLKEKDLIYKKVSESMKKHYQEKGPWNLKKEKISPLNKAIPENKWFIRGKHSSNEIIKIVCNDCGSIFESRRANLAKQEEKHPGKIYCIKCKLKGKRNPGYIDGRKYFGDNTYTKLFYDNEYRKEIIIKQNYICPICNKELEQPAHLHHIDYNKDNDNNDNLIFLHHSCHMKTNFDRDFWEIFFQNNTKGYYDPLHIPQNYIQKYFNQFPLINHNFSIDKINKQLELRRIDDLTKLPSLRGHNLSKMLNKKYFYSRKRKNNSSIVEILTSDKINEIYKDGDSLSNIINKITSQLYSFPVSLFSHHLMDWILTKWSKDGEIIYDPAGGFGGRLLGTYHHNIKYITTDPWTYDELENINNLLNLNAIINNKKSEELEIDCDMVVCCPPYYTDENYETIETRNYQEWLEQYWIKTIKNINSKKFVLIISEKYNEMINIVSNKWKEKERFIIHNKSFKSNNKEFVIYFE
ncbi:MAG: hypothetical protein ACOC3V_02495 [bacterium]